MWQAAISWPLLVYQYHGCWLNWAAVARDFWRTFLVHALTLQLCLLEQFESCHLPQFVV